MKQNLILTLLCIAFTPVWTQTQAQSKTQYLPYRYEKDFLSKEFHSGRRAAFRAKMPANSVAVFFSNPIRNRSNDNDYDYHQDPDFYYLTGHIEPNSVLLLFKEEQANKEEKYNEVLFLQERNTEDELWTGRILGTTEAQHELGIQRVLKNTDFANFKVALDAFDKILVLKLSTVEDDSENPADLFELHNRFTELLGRYGALKIDVFQAGFILSKLRAIKEPEELVLMRKAIDISCKAHIELIKSVHPGLNEYQAQSIIEYVFKNNGAEFPGYSSILGSAENTCILHYATNRKQMNNEQLLLCDAGAEYHGYTADITRTIPIDGIFSKEERSIYELVLEAQEAGIKACKAGNGFYSAHQAASKVIETGLLKLGIIALEGDYRNYFMHGTSHYLGLDVHDVGLEDELQPGNIITVEPGIYIPAGSACDKKWWNIGVRIEDDILITTGEPENLSGVIPRKVEEIEALMREKGFFERESK